MLSKIDIKTKTLLFGSAIGALIGVVAAYILLKKSDLKEDSPTLTTGQGVKIGLGILGLLKLVSDFPEEKK